MLGETVIINLLNFFVVAIFFWFVRNRQLSLVTMALMYAGIIALIILITAPHALEFLGPIANFVLSYGVFVLIRRCQGSFSSFSIFVIGGLIMLYVAFLPVAFWQALITRIVPQ